MKRLICILVAAALTMTAAVALAAGPKEPWLGDVNGEIAAKITEAIKEGRDPSVYVNVQPVTNPPSASGATSSSGQSGNIIFEDVTEWDYYNRFRNYALSWYNGNSYLQNLFGSFNAYYASVINAETRNYHVSGSDQNISLEQYLQMIINYNRIPAYQ